jgi:pyridoxal phosphate enzyme (YggS family)
MPVAAVHEAYAAGQTCFGENYVQEALGKMDALSHLSLRWHFIGRIQSNKTGLIANKFHWVHSLDRIKIARRLSEQRDPALPPLSVCLQVNLSGEPTKGGVIPDEVLALALAVAELPRLHLRGLMTVPEAGGDFESQRIPFRRLRRQLEFLNTQGLALDTLSMGMSHDIEAAIAEGATIVRIGTAIFGPRSAHTIQGG